MIVADAAGLRKRTTLRRLRWYATLARRRGSRREVGEGGADSWRGGNRLLTAAVQSVSARPRTQADRERMLQQLLLLLCCVITASRCADVLRCCPRGQKLLEGGCGPTDEPWTPLIYSERRGEYLPFGVTPAHWNLVDGGRPDCGVAGSEVRVRSSPQAPAFVLFENGSLLLLATEGMVPPGRYCVDHSEAVACVESPAAGGGAGVPAAPGGGVPKCCGPEARFSEAALACVMAEGDPGIPGAGRAQGFPACRDGEELGVVDTAPAGAGHGDHCLERLLGAAEDDVSVFACHVPAHDSPVHRDPADLRFVLYPVGLFLSCFFLACTLAAGCLLPASHHMLHWRCQTYHVACLLLGDFLLAVTHLSGHRVAGAFCLVLATSTHFMFLAAFFWLNTMCFNIWWTFRDLRPANMDKGQELRRLRVYQLYAWGFPVLVAGLAVLVDNLPAEYGSLLRPRFGRHSCWFYGDKEILAYFYAPVGVLLLMNLLLFAATARELTCGLWRGDVNSSSERSTLGRVCLKLVIVMGLTWLADVVSWAAGGPSYLWYLPDVVNTLQGVFIFAVVGCHPQVWGAVKRLWCLEERREAARGAGHLSSCSHASGRSVGELTTGTTKTLPLETLC
ncbi:probable G-protein coupled receptor Mth-like 1 [Bacillus rossius redtenbacheri]|uniref:probable G-protein coupled receptor Mth-like 1 n=1 Tax=Bacillus rossius redtenbacheri TaxID=93214 RepID=UPI002FDD386B